MSNPEAEKTEEPTDRRKNKEREKGNISKSQDLNSALMVTIGIVLLGAFSNMIMSKLKVLFYDTFTHLNPKDIQLDDILLLFLPFAKTIGEIAIPFLVILMISGILIIRMQIGHVFAVDKIMLKMENLSPSRVLENLKKMINPADPKTAVEFLKSLIKLLIVGACGFSVLTGKRDELYGLLGMDINASFIIIGSIISKMLLNMCLAMLILGLLDKKFQDYQFNKSIKMTKQEVKDEYKDAEGDPKIKAKIRSMQMQMMRQKMMAAVKTANVVVTNPTHYAVALKYDKLTAPAPVVVAKGVDFVAFKIREIAQNNNVPIVENKPLAQALYKLVKIDGIIPSDMFVAVAEVLAYVYNKDKKS